MSSDFKIVVSLGIFWAFGLVLIAQTKPAPKRPQPAAQPAPASKPAESPATIPPLPDATVRKIQAAVIKVETNLIAINDLAARASSSQQNVIAGRKEISDLKAAALSEAKLDPKLYDLDLDKLEFVLIPVTTVPNPVTPAEPVK